MTEDDDDDDDDNITYSFNKKVVKRNHTKWD